MLAASFLPNKNHRAGSVWIDIYCPGCGLKADSGSAIHSRVCSVLVQSPANICFVLLLVYGAKQFFSSRVGDAAWWLVWWGHLLRLASKIWVFNCSGWQLSW